MPSVNIAGGELVYSVDRDGADPPIVLLHPAMTSRTVWADHIDHFATNTVITADLRGHGDTGSTTVRSYDYDLFIDDLASLVDALDGSPLLVGCSLGAETALLYARKHPETITGVVAAGVAPRSGPLKYLAPVIERVQYGLTRVFGSRLVPGQMTKDEALKLYHLPESYPDGLAALLETVTAPVTLVRGPSEAEFPNSVTGQAHVTVADLPKGGHIASIRNPREFVSIIEETVN
jgi:pimeloyl-ACP methyl ester carboxylesterase